jgi:uncharacterized membrane-anchored protein
VRQEWITAALVPIVVLVVWLLLRRVRRGIERSSPELGGRRPA